MDTTQQAFFKIEEHIDIKDKTLIKGPNNYSFDEYRALNLEMNRPLNYGFPNYDEEKELAIKMFKEGATFSNLIDYFQRPKSTIKKYLEKNIHTEKAKNIFISEKSDKELSPQEVQPLSVNVDISNLTDRELFILKARWGIGLKDPLTLEEIASLLGISRERVRQIMVKNIRKIKFYT